MEYADFLVDSCSKAKTGKLERIQKRAVKLFYNDFLSMNWLDALERRRRQHHPSVMLRHSLDTANLVRVRPEIEIRSNQKIKFEDNVTQLTKVQKNP